MGVSVDEYINLVERRVDILEAIEGDSLELRTIVERAGVSRSTVNRAIRSLEDAGIVAESGGEYVLTTVGQLALTHYRSYRSRWRELVDAKDVLEGIPRDAPIDLDIVAGGESMVPPQEAPYRSLQRLQETIADVERYRGVLPGLPDPRKMRLLYEHVTTDGNPAELIVSEELRSELATSFPRRLPAMVDTGNFELFVGEVPPFGIVITEHEGGAAVTLIVFGDSGGVCGLLRNDSEAAVRWAKDQYTELRETASPATDLFRGTTDGGPMIYRRGATSLSGASIPPVLERQGFVRLNRSFFIEQEAADPTTAWRAGLDLTEIHTGYAAERTDESGTPLSDRLIDALVDGADTVLVGPPGSGKSTTAKQVACGWYQDGRGAVFYREAGAAAFEAVEELIGTIKQTDGHTLVVVEDAVRREANAVFEVIDRLDGREDVSFLLDARETEWQDPPEPSVVDDAELRVEHMPPLGEEGYERLVERFERTTGVDVDVPITELRESIRADSPIEDGDSTAPAEVLLLLHRLSTYVDSMADRPTDFEEEVTELYAELADQGQGALKVGTLVNLLNAAGIDVAPAHVETLTIGSKVSGNTVARDTLETALATLDDEALFGMDGGTYRIVHEAWSVAFLRTLFERAGEEAARELVEQCLGILLALADDPDLRERVRTRIETSEAVDRIEADPSGWADETIERLFGITRAYPKLGPLFGDAAGPSIHIPDACVSIEPADCTAWLGEAFVDRGDYGRADQLFESLLDGSHAATARLGLARTATERGEHDRAVEYAEACREMTDGDCRLAARADRLLGDVAYKRGAYDRAEEFAERGLAAARESGDQRGAAANLTVIGRVAEKRGEYETAVNHFEEVLSIARDIGDRAREATALDDLGVVATSRGDYDRAADRLTAAVEIARACGDRHEVSSALNNLGLVKLRAREYDQAREHLECALAIQRELGTRRTMGDTLGNLGIIARKQGDHEQAREYYAEHIEIAREVGNRHGEATSLSNLGILDRLAGDYEAARRRHSRALTIHREINAPEGQSISLIGLGEVAQDRGDTDRARAYYEWSLQICERIEDRVGIADAHVHLAELAVETGANDRARDHATQAAETAEEIGDTRMLAWARLVQGRLALSGDPDSSDAGAVIDPAVADDRLTAARELFEEAGDPYDIARADRWLGRATLSVGDPDGAREYFERALETFETLGTLPDAVMTLRDLIAAADRLTIDMERVEEWCERGLRYLDGLPSLREDYHDWFREHCP